jgi:hypothetical protein
MWRFVVLAVVFVACTSPQSTGHVQASPSPSPAERLQRVAAQPSDLPSGFVTCSWSGDFGKWAANVRPTDSGYAQQMLDFWQRLRSGGATAGWVQDLSVSEDACRGFYSGSAGLVRHVTSIVVLFDDNAGAVSAYQTGLTAAGLFSLSSFAGATTVSGNATGLGPESSVVTPARGPGLVAEWQHGDYYLVVVADGMSPSDAQMTVAKIDARVP